MEKYLKIGIFVAILIGFLSDPSHARNWETHVMKKDIVGAWILPGDFDNDLDDDLLIQNGDTLFWYENNLPVGSQKQFSDAVGAKPSSKVSPYDWQAHIVDTEFYDSSVSSVMILDMDNDGDLDIFQASISDSSTMAWNENRMHARIWKKHNISSYGAQLGNMLSSIGDIDKDGDNDIAYITSAEGNLGWLENIAHDTLWEKHEIGVLGTGGMWTSLADLDDDSDLDILAGRYSTGIIVWYENNQKGKSWQTRSLARLPNNAYARCVDVDNDGDLDVISYSNRLNDERIVWFENPDWHPHEIISDLPRLNPGPIGDLDRDGDPDIVFGSVDYLGWSENKNNGLEWTHHFLDTLNHHFIGPTALSDLNRDSTLDLTAYVFDMERSNIGQVRWYSNPIGLSVKVRKRSAEPPDNTILYPNSPNPFNPMTMIKFLLPQTSHVTLDIYNLYGQHLETLVNKILPPGYHEYVFEAGGYSSGVYLYQLKSQDFAKSKRMLLLK